MSRQHLPSLKESRGFTLIEVIVVIAIIAVLAAVVFPLIGRAKIAAYNSGHTAALRNVAAAQAIYAEQNDGRTSYNTSELVAHGMDNRLLSSPIDPFPKGAANVYRWYAERPERITSYRDSVLTMPDCVGDSLVDKIVESKGGGWAMIQADPPDAADQRLASYQDTAFYGRRFLRLRFDGGVVLRHVTWKRQSDGSYMTSSLWFFTDELDLFPFEN